MSNQINSKSSKETKEKFEKTYARHEEQVKKYNKKSTNCKYNTEGKYIAYRARIENCIKCNELTGRYVFQSRCGDIYCETCMKDRQITDYLIICRKCNNKHEVIVKRDKFTVNISTWECLCFSCYYGV